MALPCSMLGFLICMKAHVAEDGAVSSAQRCSAPAAGALEVWKSAVGIFQAGPKRRLQREVSECLQETHIWIHRWETQRPLEAKPLQSDCRSRCGRSSHVVTATAVRRKAASSRVVATTRLSCCAQQEMQPQELRRYSERWC